MATPDQNQMGFFARARMAISNVIRPRAFMQGPFESTRQTVTRTRIDAPPPTDFRNELTESTRREMLRLSRWLAKNSGLYRQLYKDTAIYTVGDGITMQANGGDFEWQSNIESEWENECDSPEVTGRFSMLECQYIISELLDTDGEVFIVKTKKGGQPKFQIIETHRVETPPSLVSDTSVNDGIKFNKIGQPIQYYVKQTDGAFTAIPATSMLHIYEATHPSACRGYPPHQHAINNLRDEMDLLGMEKVAAKDNSRISRILKTTDASPDMGDVGLGTPTNGTGQVDVANLNRVLGGVTAVLQPHEQLVTHQSARPTSAFTGFIDHLRRDSVMGSVPYEFLVDPTRAGGGAARLVTAKAGRYFAKRQNIVIKRFLHPYFKYWCGTKIAKGEIPNAKNWWKVDWMVTKSVTLDAARDSANERADLEMGRLPLEDDFAARGYQFEKSMRKRAKNFLFVQRLAEETKVGEEKLFKFSPQGGAPGMGGAPAQNAGITQMAVDPNDPMAQVLAAVSGQKVPDVNPDADPVADIEPEGEPPDFGKGIKPVFDKGVNVDILPRPNQGLSQPVDQPLQRRK